MLIHIQKEEIIMANKRTLKKAIYLICEELFAEGVAISLYGPRPKKDVEALLFSIVKMEHNFVTRVSHPEPGMSAKAYYKDLREKFCAQVSEISDQLNS
jgi:hypothetical protein